MHVFSATISLLFLAHFGVSIPVLYPRQGSVTIVNNLMCTILGQRISDPVATLAGVQSGVIASPEGLTTDEFSDLLRDCISGGSGHNRQFTGIGEDTEDDGVEGDSDPDASGNYPGYPGSGVSPDSNGNGGNTNTEASAPAGSSPPPPTDPPSTNGSGDGSTDASGGNGNSGDDSGINSGNGSPSPSPTPPLNPDPSAAVHTLDTAANANGDNGNTANGDNDTTANGDNDTTADGDSGANANGSNDSNTTGGSGANANQNTPAPVNPSAVPASNGGNSPSDVPASTNTDPNATPFTPYPETFGNTLTPAGDDAAEDDNTDGSDFGFGRGDRGSGSHSSSGCTGLACLAEGVTPAGLVAAPELGLDGITQGSPSKCPKGDLGLCLDLGTGGSK
ncbi:hypothetical protein EW026_g2844 [Hermanssonia centrifuga]|uniref:Uncharacterized protein n=1 Tax=Hermanssonia centrifuga TaxID=98765 RepID=A0A4S4KN06_9APHY|nr:hypothetical protein EW026_g2844 [Hermanssonia centrifuga]